MKMTGFDDEHNTKALEEARLEIASRILIVDDDPDTLSLLTFILERENYKVVTAKNSVEALDLFDEFAPDVMCVDYILPDMDGPELVKIIRARNDMVYVPIVMLTAMLGQDSKKFDSIESGVDAYLTKPISQSELKVVIRSMLRIKAAQNKMLDALERVAQVQDELLAYERRQGQYQAMRATVATVFRELEAPLNSIGQATEKLNGLVEAGLRPTSAPDVEENLQKITNAVNTAQTALRRLGNATQFVTKELADETIILDLDKRP